MNNNYSAQFSAILNEVKKAVIGKDPIIIKVLLAILCKGHVLIEDIPGVGKTTLALAFSKALSLEHNRMQFTPDVLPSDVTGFNVYNKATGKFEFRTGVAFCNLFLADEINRTSSKTQSALLELMEEKSITVDGNTYKLPEPYTVIATQNPIGSAGTHNLPDSQLDRFMIKLSMGYPDFSGEVNILRSKYNSNPLETVKPVADADSIMALQEYISNIYVDDRIYEYIVSLSAATRNHPMIKLGVSPRGTLALMQIAKGVAVASGRDYVIPDDITYICNDVFEHRIMLNSKAKLSDVTAGSVIKEVINSVPVPGISTQVR
ncbi:MAG: MoxR family ATPase [Ruminococcus sp.]|uniref:AAA family ATPase n=1 Tax=Ruminococcus sp. TaxID=41978 RepID=UPI0025FE9D7E|nr:MoxR family ATPase [Ruminococcus sp.]MBQ3884874.1 MoxR family ATPase [Ruminococcus sp.]MBQ3948203.1 MoxR family ATPase [Ruminococcus sp.]MBR6393514.1 MoxR family ATPase [Ruminococcus sp.]MCR4796274.1 MoxR family ATPase [Ruminococcus sp.]